MNWRYRGWMKAPGKPLHRKYLLLIEMRTDSEETAREIVRRILDREQLEPTQSNWGQIAEARQIPFPIEIKPEEVAKEVRQKGIWMRLIQDTSNGVALNS